MLAWNGRFDSLSIDEGSIRLLYEALLSGISTEENRDVETESRNGTNLVQCYRAQVLTPGECEILRKDSTQRILVANSKPYDNGVENDATDMKHDVYDFPKAELPKQAFYDVFQVVGEPSAPEPHVNH